MRARIAKRIVRHVARALDVAYESRCRAERARTAQLADHWRAMEETWAAYFRWRERWLLPVARRIDHEAAVEQMVTEGWWG